MHQRSKGKDIVTQTITPHQRQHSKIVLRNRSFNNGKFRAVAYKSTSRAFQAFPGLVRASEGQRKSHAISAAIFTEPFCFSSRIDYTADRGSVSNRQQIRRSRRLAASWLYPPRIKVYHRRRHQKFLADTVDQ